MVKATHLEEEAQLQAPLMVQVVGAAHVAIHVGHAQGEALPRQAGQLRCSHRLPVACMAVCCVAGPHVPAWRSQVTGPRVGWAAAAMPALPAEP